MAPRIFVTTESPQLGLQPGTLADLGTTLHALQFREDSQERWHEVMIEGKAEGWMDFACKTCGTPLAVQRSDDASKSGQHSARGWRVTCTGCGTTDYYAPGTPMVKITVSD
jgi:hypothetical protein